MPPASKGPTGKQIEYLQLLADGLSIEEIAARLYVVPSSIISSLKRARQKYGVHSSAAAVARALADGLIEPDRTAARCLPRNKTVRSEARSIRRLIRDERAPQRDARLLALSLDALLSWTEPHAVSVLWGAGVLTAQDVPPTRNEYQIGNQAQTRTEDEAVCMNGTR